MEIWGRIILAVDVAALAFLMRSAYRLMKVMRSAGRRLIHVFPTKGLLVGTLLVNLLGILTTVYAFVRSYNAVYLLLLAVFLLNEFTAFQRIVGIHEKGMVLYSRLTPFEDMKKVIWGQERKKFVELRIILRDKDAPPLWLNVPIAKKEEVNSLLRTRIR